METNQRPIILDQKRALIFIIVSIILFYFIFAPGVNIFYYAADDFRYAFGGYTKACNTDDGFYFAWTLGRPIQAYMDCLSYKFGYTLGHMALIRFISVVLMGCVAGLFAEWLCWLGFSIGAAFFAAGSFFLIYQLYAPIVLMGTTSLIFPLLLTLAAYLYLNKERIVVSAILILCALLIYPAMTFFFSTLILTKLLFTSLADWSKTRREIFREVAFFCIMCAIYFLLAYLNMHYYPQAPVPDAYRLDHPNLNPIEILKRFIFLGNIFNNIWEFLPSGNTLLRAWTMLIVLLGGSVLGLIRFTKSSFYNQDKKIALAYLGQAVFVVIALCILSSALILVIPKFAFTLNVGELWLLFGTFSAGLALGIWSIKQWSFIFSSDWRRYIFCALLGLFYLMEAYQANINTTAKAIGFNQYMNFVQVAISNYLEEQKELRRIHFIVSKTEYPYDSFFSANAALMQRLGHGNYTLQWCSLPRGVPGKEKDHQKEAVTCIQNLPKNGIAVTYSYPAEPFQKTNSMLLINMQNVNNRKDYYLKTLKQYFGIQSWQ